MTLLRIAVLGGDAREVHLARRLAEAGHDCVSFGHADVDGITPVSPPTLDAAVTGRQWLICPSPGLADGTRVFAPSSSVPISLDEAMLRQTDAASGGLILGRISPAVGDVTARLGIPVYEMKDDRALATRLSTGVAEGCMALLIQMTTRILREHRIVLTGYGVTGAVILDYLLGAGCAVSVAARSDLARERARQRGASPVNYEDRADAFAEADLIINTVPDVEAVPSSVFSRIRGALVLDIASPPGGIDHDGAMAAGVRVHWARGLAGGRAPETAGDAQYAFVERILASRGDDTGRVQQSLSARSDRRSQP